MAFRLNDWCDYYETLDEHDPDERREGARPAMKVGSPEGKKFIKKLMKETKDDFMKELKELRENMDSKSDEELWKDWQWRRSASEVAFEAGPHVRLYDWDGNPILSTSLLEQALRIYVDQDGSALWLSGKGIKLLPAESPHADSVHLDLVVFTEDQIPLLPVGIDRPQPVPVSPTCF